MSAPTPCDACGELTTGIDCEKCGASCSRACPECSQPFGRADRYCSGCGHDLKFVNFSNRTILRFPRHLGLEAFQYPPDRESLRMLSKAGPIKVLARFLENNWSEPYLHGALEGTAVKVTPKQFPRIRRIADACQRILHMEPTDVFIRHDTTLGATALGSEKSSAIVLTSGLVENLSERELLFVVGRELGHIKADHMFYLNMSRMITENRILQSIPFLGEGLRAFVVLFLLPWQRKSHITADRAGLLCCQNRATAVKTLIKMSLGAKSLYDKVDIEEFLNQAEEVNTRRLSIRNMGEYMSGFPFVTNRVKEIEAFNFSQAYHDVFANALHPFRPGLACPGCSALAYAENVEEALMRLSCADCGAAVPVLSLPCPHCGTDVPAGDVGMRDQSCPGCEEPFLCASLRDLMPPPGELYHVLGLSRQASYAEVQNAFAVKAKALETSASRLPYYRAYSILHDRRRRKEYDEKVPFLLEFESEELRSLPSCAICEAPMRGIHCGWCGARPPEPPPEGEVAVEPVGAGAAASSDSVEETPAPEPPERFHGPVN